MFHVVGRSSTLVWKCAFLGQFPERQRLVDDRKLEITLLDDLWQFRFMKEAAEMTNGAVKLPRRMDKSFNAEPASLRFAGTYCFVTASNSLTRSELSTSQRSQSLIDSSGSSR
jgi:hypothetical protein